MQVINLGRTNISKENVSRSLSFTFPLETNTVSFTSSTNEMATRVKTSVAGTVVLNHADMTALNVLWGTVLTAVATFNDGTSLEYIFQIDGEFKILVDYCLAGVSILEEPIEVWTGTDDGDGGDPTHLSLFNNVYMQEAAAAELIDEVRLTLPSDFEGTAVTLKGDNSIRGDSCSPDEDGLVIINWANPARVGDEPVVFITEIVGNNASNVMNGGHLCNPGYGRWNLIIDISEDTQLVKVVEVGDAMEVDGSIELTEFVDSFQDIVKTIRPDQAGFGDIIPLVDESNILAATNGSSRNILSRLKDFPAPSTSIDPEDFKEIRTINSALFGFANGLWYNSPGTINYSFSQSGFDLYILKRPIKGPEDPVLVDYKLISDYGYQWRIQEGIDFSLRNFRVEYSKGRYNQRVNLVHILLEDQITWLIFRRVLSGGTWSLINAVKKTGETVTQYLDTVPDGWTSTTAFQEVMLVPMGNALSGLLVNEKVRVTVTGADEPTRNVSTTSRYAVPVNPLHVTEETLHLLENAYGYVFDEKESVAEIKMLIEDTGERTVTIYWDTEEISDDEQSISFAWTYGV